MDDLEVMVERTIKLKNKGTMKDTVAIITTQGGKCCIKCIVCGSESLTKSTNKKYCSRNCRNNAPGKREKDRINAFLSRGRGALKHCICNGCGTPFETYSKRAYCKIECRRLYRPPLQEQPRHCITCGNEYQPRRRYQKYCKKSCNKYRKSSIEPFYNTSEWLKIRADFIKSTTLVNGISLSNRYCIACYVKQNKLNDMYAVDHIVRRKDGGSDDHSNLQSLCLSHHQSKSATEGNSTRDKSKQGGRPKTKLYSEW